MKAAVLHQVGETKLDLRDDVTTIDVGAGQVKVAIKATGVCHSDLSAMNGTLPSVFPLVLGHEGAGEIVEVGAGVTDIAVGDHVIVCWSPQCGNCRYCINGQPQLCMHFVMQSFIEPRFLMGGAPCFGMAGAGTFTEQVVIPSAGAIKVANDVPFDVASLIGCGVMTGAGAALNAAKVEPGSTVLVIGCGGVGISAIQGARICGASTIVAVDMVDRKLEWAKTFGATHTATPDQVPGLIQELTGGEGFDYCFEVVGRGTTIRSAYDWTRRGGTAIVVGVGRAEDMVSFSAFEFFYTEKTIKGTYYGSANIRRDFPRLLDLWRAGRLDLEGMITRRLALEDINDAFVAMEAGEVIRQVVEI